MFWTLLFCHLLADYPLQTDAMVQAKKRLPGLALHVGVHLVTMVVIVFGVIRMAWWPAGAVVLTVTMLHFAIDSWKNVLSKRKPQWVIGGYLQDQVLHIASLLVVAGGGGWVADGVYAPFSPVPPAWVIYGSGYILVTHAWFVTERVLTYRNQARQQLVNAALWPRMMSRALLLTLLLWGWPQVNASQLGKSGFFLWPYRATAYRLHFLLIDLVVTLTVLAFIVLAR